MEPVTSVVLQAFFERLSERYRGAGELFPASSGVISKRSAGGSNAKSLRRPLNQCLDHPRCLSADSGWSGSGLTGDVAGR